MRNIGFRGITNHASEYMRNICAFANIHGAQEKVVSHFEACMVLNEFYRMFLIKGKKM